MENADQLKTALLEIPAIGSTSDIPFKDKLLVLHFSFGTSHWYPVEFDGDNTLFGCVVEGDQPIVAWGDFTLSSLRSPHGYFSCIDGDNGRFMCRLPLTPRWDASWTPCPFSSLFIPPTVMA